MSKWNGRHETCPICGVTYEAFKTGMSFGDVRMMLWVGDPDYDKWKYKRRHTVLGLWHSIKKSMWDEHVYMCEEQLNWTLQQLDSKETLPAEIEELLKHLPREAPPAWMIAPAGGYLDEVPF